VEAQALDLGREWAMLELLCRGLEGGERTRAFERLLSERPDWGQLVDQATRHRMLAMLAGAVLDLGAPGVPIRVQDLLSSVLALNRYRRRACAIEAGRVVGALSRRGIAVAARKGLAYESDVYGGAGRRWVGDIDLMVLPEAAEETASTLAELGYELGLYDYRRRVVAPFERSEIIRYRLNPDHLPTYSLATGDELLPVQEVDVATSLTWSRSSYQVPTADALAGVGWVPVTGLEGVSMPAMAPPFLFLDTVLHLFREAWVDWWLEKEQDVDLLKFGDVVRLWERHRGTLAGGRLRAMLERYGVTEPVAWVLEHLDRTFDLDSVRELGLAGAATEEFLGSGNARGGAVAAWRGTMRERLHVRDRRSLFADG
jgi:Uncharacterised nucleotidyltransferase